MISVNELRAGTTFRHDGQPYIVLKFEHIKMGRGTAWIKVKVRHLLTGATTEKSFISGNRVEPIATSRKKYQYLYQSGGEYYFMDPKTFEQIPLPSGILADQANFLKEGVAVDVLFLEEKPLAIELPQKMEFTVVETGPGVKGNSATNIFKSAILDSGLKIKTPLFVEEGEKILVDTRTGEYLERVR